MRLSLWSRRFRRLIPPCIFATESYTIRAQLGALRLSDVIVRNASGASSARWLNRQGKDQFTRQAKVNALKSRAAFKLLEIDQKFRLFRPGQTVVDLGYAPGSWSQVAISRVKPGGRGKGRVLGIDLIPAQPPRGVSTIQGDFLRPEIREMVVDFVRDESAGLPKIASTVIARAEEMDDREEDVVEDHEEEIQEETVIKTTQAAKDKEQGRVVDVVLSDMSAPWPLVSAWVNSVVNPYRRMMNTSGNAFRDHVGSMDLCLAALSFAYDTLKSGGHFVCKYYQGGEEKDFETRLKALFDKVHRVKPDSSRKESREAYFLALRRKPAPSREDVFNE